MQKKPAHQRKILRSILKTLIKIIFSLFVKFEINGEENIPNNESLIYVSNHFGFLDPLIHIFLLKQFPEFLSGSEIPNAPKMVSWIRHLWGVYYVTRGSVNRESIYQAVDLLKNGKNLVVYPEGGCWANVLRPARPGTALIALKSGARILPIGIDGSDRIFPLIPGKRKLVKINFGEPFSLLNGNGKKAFSKEVMETFGHEIMKSIVPLIPFEKHGYYSADPEIKEAARGTEIYPWG